MEDVMANTILKELREFRAENNKRWEANDNGRIHSCIKYKDKCNNETKK